jgi:hypothetical protein
LTVAGATRQTHTQGKGVSIIDFIMCTTRNIYGSTGAGVSITDVIALITRDIHVGKRELNAITSAER